MTYRVIQWTTGNVGRRTLRALIENPLYELVGIYARSADKVGRDAGELCGLDQQVGVRATDDIEALIALKPDACVFTPMWSDVDTTCRLLAAGINVVTTAAFITGLWMGEDKRAQLEAAAREGGATLYGSGVNPGFANIMAITSTQVCARVDQIRVTESADSTAYDSWATEVKVGFGQKPGTPGLVEGAREATEVFSDAVEMMADALDVTLDEITYDIEYFTATADNELGYATIRAGEITAVDGRWRGRVDGRDVIVLRHRWLKGPNVEPGFELDHGYLIEVDGLPGVRTHIRHSPSADWNEPDYMGLGMIITGMPALNAIPAVVAAAPGIARMDMLNAFGARGAVPRKQG
jgi:4-hydroxy-tetrahydrodipicolinate reductase